MKCRFFLRVATVYFQLNVNADAVPSWLRPLSLKSRFYPREQTLARSGSPDVHAKISDARVSVEMFAQQRKNREPMEKDAKE